MLNAKEKLRSCDHYITQPRNFSSEKCNTQCNHDATISLKGLAQLLLQRNWRCNSDATVDKNQCNFTTKELKEFLGEDWDDYKNNPEALALWADLLFKNQLIEQGIAPNNFTAITDCVQCGYVYVPPSLVNGGKVLGCPWCWNRAKALAIPRPDITNLNIT